MKLLIGSAQYEHTIDSALGLSGLYPKPVIFHSYWNGPLNEKHFYSILSCYYFNVYKNKHKVILWVENNIPNQYSDKIKQYAEIKYFSLTNEKNDANLNYYNYNFSSITYYSDLIRNLLLYNYGGVWFDLDCFILRSFDPIFYNYENEICVYQWEHQNYPNNAIYISLWPKSEKMKSNIDFIINRNRGWGFQQADLTYGLPLDLLVLPCSWFDGGWIKNPHNLHFDHFFDYTDKTYNFDIFFKGCFCYHWHNKWNNEVNDRSPVIQLITIIQTELQTNEELIV